MCGFMCDFIFVWGVCSGVCECVGVGVWLCEFVCGWVVV